MAVLDRIPGRPPPPRQGERYPGAVPPDIDAKLRRGREARDRDRNVRELCRKFWKGDHYSFITPAGGLSYQVAGGAGIVGRGKPVNRIRNTYNFIQSIVEGKVSAATQQVPGYEVTPATADPDDEAAASLAAQVATYGYDKWRIRRHATKAITNALVAREGFVMPYFDPDVGPFTATPDGRVIGQGEIRLLDLSRDQVMWEPDEDFEESRWHAIERSMHVDKIAQIPGYVPGSMDRDSADEIVGQASKPGKITVTEYLERPCPRYPDGRRVFIALGRVICDYSRVEEGADYWEPYPSTDASGKVTDDLVIHRISYTVNPDPSEGDLGLVERVIDLNRTINDTWNKILEIKNRALLLQSFSPKGSSLPRRDDTPGANYEYNPVQGNKPEWERPPDPSFIAQLLEIHREAVQELRALSADVDIQPTARLAEGTAQLAQTQAAARWGSFLGDLAEFHSRVMRHCLTLVARYYDSERQIDIRGQYGWESSQAFSGQDLRSQVNVRVAPGTLFAKSREAMRAEVEWVNRNWPGAVSPEAGLAFIHGGAAEGLIKGYQNHVARARRIIQRLMDGGPDALEQFGERWDPTVPDLSAPMPPPPVSPIDPLTGMPALDAMGNPILPPPPAPWPPMGVAVPGWMPGPQDNPKVWRQVFSDHMTTEKFEQLPPEWQEPFYIVLDGLDHAERMRAAKQAAQQEMQAQSLGAANAAKPQLPTPLPSNAGFGMEPNRSPLPDAPQ